MSVWGVSMKENPIRVLMADDDKIIHGVVEHFLRVAGFTLESAYNGRQALEMAEKNPPRVLILDSLMPELDGPGVLWEWHRRPALTGIPVIMLTSQKGETDKIRAQEYGVADYLTKPFSPDELVEKVSKFVRQPPPPPRPPALAASPPPLASAPANPLPFVPSSPPPPAAGTPRMPTRFQGSVRLDETRLAFDAGRIEEQVISQLLALHGADVAVTLTIDAKCPGGVPPEMVNSVTQECRTLRFEHRRFD